MNEILRFLITYCSDLYNKHGFRFEDSEISSSFDNAYLKLGSETLEIVVILDRSQLFMDFRSRCEGSSQRAYSIDLVHQLLLGHDGGYSVLDEECGRFLQNNIGAILDRFRCSEACSTIRLLDDLRAERGRRRFAEGDRIVKAPHTP